jgi:hypothetical protein
MVGGQVQNAESNRLKSAIDQFENSNFHSEPLTHLEHPCVHIPATQRILCVHDYNARIGVQPVGSAYHNAKRAASATP